MAGYRDLVFYQKNQEVVKGVDQLIRTWLNTLQAQIISRQLFRAATSVGANIAEVHGRHQGKEYIHYLTISQGFANEVDHWLHTAIDCELGNNNDCLVLIDLHSEVCKMLNATIHTLKKRLDNHSIRDSSSPYTLSPYPNEDTEL
jgi:four helix bundle protein